ncbi:MAG: transporter [Nitrospinales bacterium]
MNQRKAVYAVVLAVVLALIAPGPALGFKFDLHGSLGKGKKEEYIAPMANPLFNETPYITTEARIIYLYHKIPNTFLTGGGRIQVWAVQARVAITERLGFIATKDGAVDADFTNALNDTEGAENITFGFKYALLNQPKKSKMITAGLRFEVPTGSLQTSGIRLQGDGSGFVDLFVTGTTEILDDLNLQGSFGSNLALDGAHDSSFVHYSLHLDYELPYELFPMIEINGFSTIDSGTRLPGVDFEGVDLVNFGSTKSGTVATLNTGLTYRFNDHVQIGGGYEFPFSSRKDLFQWRVNSHVIISF